MKNLKITLLGVLGFGLSIIAQQPVRNCGSHLYNEHQESLYPGVKKSRVLLEQKILNDKQWRSSNRENGSITTIPVVVHVLYSSAETNISEAQIQSQIDVLNKDFRKLNNDISTVLASFQSIAHDAEIQFCLASIDPEGQVTSGITRTPTSVTSFPLNDNMKKSSTGGMDAWDPSAYLNLWVVPGLDDNVLGFAQFPGGQAWSDGVVIADQFFGTEGTVNMNGSFNKGRTATHEIGHYLGLRHIWGDSNCGNDQVDDTPTQQESSTGCPLSSNTCDGKLDNVQNYMDYSDDDCMVMFTTGQAERMWGVLNSSRSGLKNAAITKCANDNPPTVAFTANKTNLCAGGEVEFLDQSTGLPTSWSWTFENGTPATSTLQNPSVVFSTGGIHTVTLWASNSNGPGQLEVKNGYIITTELEKPQVQVDAYCGGEADLIAVTNVAGAELQWYSDSTLVDFISGGPNYTATVSQNTKFYVTASTSGQPLIISNLSPGMGGFHAGGQGIYFSATEDFILNSIQVTAQAAGDITIEYTPSGEAKQSQVYSVYEGVNTININLTVPQGVDHQLFMPTGGVFLHRDNTGVSYPYALSTLGSVTKSTAAGVELDYYYYFYNWEIQKVGCESDAQEVEVNYDLCVSVPEFESEAFKMYPNPSFGVVNLLNISGQEAFVFIYSINGSLVKKVKIQNGTIITEQMNSGVYMVQFRNDRLVQNQRLIIR